MENGSRSFDIRCLMWFMGPMRTENLQAHHSSRRTERTRTSNSPKHHEQTSQAANIDIPVFEQSRTASEL